MLRRHQCSQAFGQFRGRYQGGFWQEHGKLFTPDAAQCVYPTQATLQHAYQVLEHQVPHVMTVGVVDQLEVVYVQHDEGGGVARALGALKFSLQLLHEGAAVFRPCQRIAVSQLMQRVDPELAIRDVVHKTAPEVFLSTEPGLMVAEIFCQR